jgi:Protein of unknown function (DUF3375)
MEFDELESLYHLNERLGEGAFPRSAREYLESWAAPESGWLRKYYPVGAEEAYFDATRHPTPRRRWGGCPRCGRGRSSVRNPG